MRKATGKVIETDEYKIFKRLTGNRSVTSVRVKKLIKSLQEFGYIGSPIVINENYEVCDGQARIEACKSLSIPVPYTIKPGIGINECQALNRYSTTWKLMDYIEMYAELGDENYIHLMNLMKEFNKKGISARPISFATTGKTNSNDDIIARRYVCTEKAYVNSRKILSDVANLVPFLKRAAGRKDVYISALIIFAYHPKIDFSHLAKRMEANQMDIISVGTVMEALQILEDIYNTRCRNKVYIVADYKRALESKISWFWRNFN